MNSRTQDASITIGMVLYPGVTLLDVAGPYEVFARLPGVHVALWAASLDPIRTEQGMNIVPDTRFDETVFDVLFVPGGPGQTEVIEDERFLGAIRRYGEAAQWVTSVCTGSLLLAAAGLLRGRRATTHWLSLDLLERLGVQTVRDRVVIDGNRITAAGVSAGIDLALVVAARLLGEEVAKEIQLLIEYDPKPMFRGGSVQTADPYTVERVTSQRRALQERRRAQIERIAARLVDYDPLGNSGST